MSNESSFHKFTRNFFAGNVEGHADACSRIRKKDGLLFRGDEIGVVDHDGRIRKKEGRIFQSDEVGRVRGRTATGKDGLVFRGQELGYIDANGVVCKKEGLLFKGERIGSLHGHDCGAALGFYVLKFQEIIARYEQLQAEFEDDTEKGTYLWRIQRLQQQVTTARALGDGPRLLKKLKEMEYRCNRALDRNLSIKRSLCLKLEGLSDSSDWRNSGLKVKQYQKDWNATGPVPGSVSKALLACFRAATTLDYQKASGS